MKEVRIFSLQALRDGCVVVLEEEGGTRLLPIIIGYPEAEAIARRLRKDAMPRPMTHDLMASLIDAFSGKVMKVVVNDLQDNTFFAYILIRQNGRELKVDSRPSDAIALALRAECPIFVEDRVFEVSQPILKPITQDEVKKFKQEIEKMSPDELMKRLKGESEEGPGPDEEER